MRYSLINPPWSFEGSIYFGCREPHLPLEFGYSKVLLERAGHEVQVIDGQLDGLGLDRVREGCPEFRPDFTVVTTAPSYLFWRCAPPELRVPMEVVETRPGRRRNGGRSGTACFDYAAGDTAKTQRGCGGARANARRLCRCWPAIGAQWIPSAISANGEFALRGRPHACNMTELPALRWDRETIAQHSHHHHRFDAAPVGPGRRWRRPAAAPITARSARRRIFAICSGGVP